MRWIAVVADVHRILTRGGVSVSMEQTDPTNTGKLRLMYEDCPMSWLIDKHGQRCLHNSRHLDIQPGKLHEARDVVLGSKTKSAASPLTTTEAKARKRFSPDLNLSCRELKFNRYL
jgi:fructose-1,6-bisphosphatase